MAAATARHVFGEGSREAKAQSDRGTIRLLEDCYWV
jgi:hypothetical protein